MPFDPFGDPSRLFGREHRVERGRRRSVQGIRYQHHLLSVGIEVFDQPAHDLSEVLSRPPLGDPNRTPARQRREQHGQVGGPVTYVLVVKSLRLSRRHRQWLHHLTDQLCARLVHANQGTPRVEGSMIDFQDVFHPADELGVGRRGNAPLGFQPRLKDVFLSTRRTVSSETASTICNSTNLSASSCTVQRVRSWGGGVHARAIRYASARPSSVRSRLGWSWGLRLRAAVSPCSTNRRRTRSTVATLTSTAPARRISIQSGPSALTSALSRRRAWVSLLADALPTAIKSHNCWRSSA